MKILTFITTLLLVFTILQSCSDKKEKIIIEFLNKTEDKFDKTKYELVELKLLDTIYETEVYDYSNYLNYPILPPVYEELDTIAMDENYVANEVYWNYELYSRKFYDYLRYDENYSIYTNSIDEPNLFLNSIVNLDYQTFKKKLLSDTKFQNNLKTEISYYEYFKGIYSPDSLLKLVNIENLKSKTIFGHLYELNFRSNSELRKRKLIYDNENKKIILYENKK